MKNQDFPPRLAAKPKPAPDAAARREAIDPSRSFIVQAPAGSGKTELLTQRFLALLATADWPEEIAAVTFTRKAEAEMRGRIDQFLRAAARGKAKDLRPDTLALAQAVLARDRERGWELLASPRRLRIQTFDAWCNRLSRQMPYLTGLGGTPPISEDARPLYAAAARETLNLLEADGPWVPALERLLAHLDNRDQTLAELLADILARRDHWLRLPIAKGLSRGRLEAGLQDTIREHLAVLRGNWPAGIAEELLRLARYAAGQLQEMDLPSPTRQCQDLAHLPGTDLDDLRTWLGIADLLLTQDGAWRKKVNKNNGFPPGKETVARKQRLMDVIASLDGEEALRNLLHGLRQLPPAQYADAQWAVLAALADLLPVALAQLRLAMLDQGQVDFAEVALAALHALGPPEEPTDLALQLDYRLRHVLVDEFQDTSVTQLYLLEKLTAGWQPGDGRTLFLVGDPMQSIYRFRDAEVGIFLRICTERRLGDVALTPLRLSANFRAQSGLVEWFNASFPQVFPVKADPQSGAVPYTPAEAVHPAESPACRVHVFAADEAGVAVHLVKAALSEDPRGTVAILARRRRDLGPIASALKDAGLRFRAVETESLATRPAIQDLLALTRALAHPADRTAWLAVLRAPWCGLELMDLHALCGDEWERTIWELLMIPERLQRLSKPGQVRAQRLIAALAPVQRALRRRALRDRVETAWLRLGGPACLDRGGEADVLAYLDALSELEAGGDLSDFANLSERAAALYAAPDSSADERISLMTIHKAKGLEFDTVILPGLARGAAPDRSRLLRWREVAAPGGQSRLLLAPIAESGGGADPVNDYLKLLEKNQLNQELKRLLYVAATRTKRRLHWLVEIDPATVGTGSGLKKPADSTLLGVLWPAVEAEIQAQFQKLAPEEQTAVAAPVSAVRPALQRLPADWSLPAPPPDVWAIPPALPAIDTSAGPEFQWAQLGIRRLGTVIHQWLKLIASEGLDRWDAKRVARLAPALERSLAAQGVPAESLAGLVAAAQQALSNLLADERGRWLLDDSRHQDPRSEWALSGMLGERLVNVVVDRSFVDAEGRRWIVDYKTSRHTGGKLETFLDQEQARYRPQLETYAAIMSGLEQRPIHLGLYFPLLRAWRAWTPG